jgi:HAD superfamily hydrolase (TIGR01509 family)
MNKNNTTLLIFDCDGVLVDSEPLANRIIIQCFRNEGFDIDEAYADKHFLGISNRDCVAHIESVFNRRVSDNFIETYSYLTKEEIKKTLQPIPHIKEALNMLSYPKCVASGGELETIHLSLEITKLKKHFTHIYSSLQVPRGKPFPDIFLHAAKEMNFTPDQCIVIEDSGPGVEASLSAGMRVLLYSPLSKGKSKFAKEVTAFNDMSKLPDLIQSIIQKNRL